MTMTTTEVPQLVHERASALAAAHGGEPRVTALSGEDRWEAAAVRDRGDDGALMLAEAIIHGDGTCALLQPGTPIRHQRHPDLTGRIKAIEYARPGVVSGIPYCIAWDDSGRAHDVLGMLFVYATDHTIEVIA